jgi:hypothetical protein
MLPTYQKDLCAKSKKEIPETNRIDKIKILNILIINREENENNSIDNLLFNFISGAERFNISRR